MSEIGCKNERMIKFRCLSWR